jgi:recombination protein RecR
MLIPLPLEQLLRTLGKLPGFGPRSARRVALHLVQNGEKMEELLRLMDAVRQNLGTCSCCGNLALKDGPDASRLLCETCTDLHRATGVICVVEGIADVWALERSGQFKGRYHVLGGVVSALNGVTPEDVRIPELLARVAAAGVGPSGQPEAPVEEVILALGSTIDGQTTAQMIADALEPLGVRVTTLAKGMPVGAAVDYMDEGTLAMALSGRRDV